MLSQISDSHSAPLVHSRRLQRTHGISVVSVVGPQLRLSVLQDLRYIHESKLKSHGNLNDATCMIDRHFTLKISQLGYGALIEELLSNGRTIAHDKNHRFSTTARRITSGATEFGSNNAQAANMRDTGLLIYENLTVTTSGNVIAQGGVPGELRSAKALLGPTRHARSVVDRFSRHTLLILVFFLCRFARFAEVP